MLLATLRFLGPRAGSYLSAEPQRIGPFEPIEAAKLQLMVPSHCDVARNQRFDVVVAGNFLPFFSVLSVVLGSAPSHPVALGSAGGRSREEVFIFRS